MAHTNKVASLDAALQHIEKDGTPKIRERCLLPLTGKRCVKVIVTELAVFDVLPDGLMLREVYPGVDVEHLRSITEAGFRVSEKLCEMNLEAGMHSVSCALV